MVTSNPLPEGFPELEMVCIGTALLVEGKLLRGKLRDAGEIKSSPPAMATDQVKKEHCIYFFFEIFLVSIFAREYRFQGYC